MDSKRLLLCLSVLCPACWAGAADNDYVPLGLGGLNADIVVSPLETVADAADGASCFYSEAFRLRGGLPRKIHGMFSDVPYSLADFGGDCALKVASPDIDAANGTSYGATGRLTLREPQGAKTLWLLATAPDGAARLRVTVNFSDGTSREYSGVDVPGWSAASCDGTAFWQLGTVGRDLAAADATDKALYEIALNLGAEGKAVSSIDIGVEGKGRSACVLAVTASGSEAPAELRKKKLFFVSDSHLDTQWNWTVKNTIGDYLKNTLLQNFTLFNNQSDRNFTFNFEGAIKYMWAKEYYPAEYEKLKKFVASGRWNIAGAAIDASDVNIGSAESLIRNFLYGQSFYRKEFGVRGGRDVMLPDCFGFPWSLPTVAAHCGMKYFHTQKLSWNSAYAYSRLPRFARWKGVDGEEVLSALKMGAYDAHEEFRKDMSQDATLLAEAGDNLSSYGLPAAIRYVGPRGDRGGGLDQETAGWLSKSVDGTGELGVTMNSSTGMLDQLFHMGYDRLPVIDHSLPMRAHGVGGYTSRTMLKYWMRKGELLGDAAEKSSVAASWLGALPYQRQTLTDSWVRLLWHQFHDDVPGTCINDAYRYSVNDLVLDQLDFSRTMNNAVGGVARFLDTSWCGDVPVVVYNPLSIERTDIVEATASLPQGTDHIVVTDATGAVVPSQITGSGDGGAVRFIFLAKVPSLGYATYNVAPSAEEKAPDGQQPLSVSESSLENSRYKVTLDANGDVASVKDKQNGDKEMLSAPIRLAMLFDESLTWPSWEIHGDQLQKAPREYVDKEGLQVEVAERGPLRASLKVTRRKNGSDFVQYIRLAAEGAADRIDFVNEVNWQTRERLLKAVFPLTVSNPKATYDLSIGADVNANSTDYSTDTNSTGAMCEFLGHEWADVTDKGGECGVSILNDCKYGWDKQKDNEIRLSLIHTPKVGDSYSYQGRQDLGLNRFTYSFFAHKGGWGADTQWEADRLNEPLVAYGTTRGAGSLGTEFAFVKTDNRNVAVKALKKAEEGDAWVVRFYELTGEAQDVVAEFPADIVDAKEVNGVEEPLAKASFSGNRLTFHIDRFHPKTFEFTLAPSTAVAAAEGTAPRSEAAALDCDVDVMSYNSRPSDADVDEAFPAELVPDEVTADGIVFTIGDKADGRKNAVRCKGQTVRLPQMEGTRKVYVLASSLNEDGSEVSFGVGGKEETWLVDYYGGMVGVFSNSADTPKKYRMQNTAFTATHSHGKSGDNVYDYLYMYKYAFDVATGTEAITLPDDPDVLVYAVSVSDNANDDTRPLSEVVSVLRHEDTPDTYREVTHDDEAIKPQSVTASAYTNGSEAPAKACDGDVTTKWCDNAQGVRWLEYRFAKPMTVTGWKVTNAGCEGDGKIGSAYCLQRFTEGGWVDVERVTDNADNVTDFVLQHPFVSEGVRLRVVKAEQGGNGAARVYEFTVYGHEPEEADYGVPQVISRVPTYGYGRQVATVVSSSGRTKAAEDAYFMFDNDEATKWCYNGSLATPQAVVELSDVYDISRFDIYDAGCHEDYANSGSYEIQYSLDGKTYATAATRSGVASENVHVCELAQPVRAKYVKLLMSKGGGGALRVYGFDIWGAKSKEQPLAAGELLSLHKTVVGSYKCRNFNESALNLVDGEKGKKELTWNFSRPSSSEPYSWAVVDLGESCTINKFVIRDGKSCRAARNISGYRIFVSDTKPSDAQMKLYCKSSGGSGWTRVADVTGVGNDNVKTFVPEATASGRYVKLEIPNTAVTDSAMIAEFEVYGSVPTGIDRTLADGSGLGVSPKVVDAGEPIALTSGGAPAAYVLASLSGETVATGRFTERRLLPTASLKRGVYVLRLSSGSAAVTEKITVR